MAIRRSAHWFKMLMAKEGTAKMHRNSWWGWVIYIQGIYFKISIIKTVPLSIPHSLIILYTVHSSFYVTLGLDRWFTHTWANLRNSITTLWALIVSSGKKKKKWGTIDLWRTGLWTSLVHTYADFFQILQYHRVCSWLNESANSELRIWRASYKLYLDFWLHRGSAPLTPALFKGQLY